MDSLMLVSMMVAAGPGGQLVTAHCKFDGAQHPTAAGQVGLLSTPASALATGLVPMVQYCKFILKWPPSQ